MNSDDATSNIADDSQELESNRPSADEPTETIETALPEESDDFSITLKSRGVTVALDDPDDDQVTLVQPAASRPTAAARSAPPVASPNSAPPAKIPPTSVAPPAQSEPFHVRYRKWMIPLLVVACLFLLFAIYLLVKSFTTPESEKISAESNSIVMPINDDVDDADKLTDFRGAARSARIARPKLASLQQRAKQVGNGTERAAVVALLDAQTALLNAYAGMADLRRNNLKPVDNLTDQADAAARDIKAAVGQLAAAGRSAGVDSSGVDSAVDNMTGTLKEDEKLMARWSRKAKSQRRKRELFASQSGGLTTISNEFMSQRNEVAQFYNAPPSETYSSGGTTIEGLESERSSLATRARTADAEPLLRGARGALAHALDMSVRAFPKLRKAWAAQSRTETVAQSSLFPPYDRATDAVDRNWNIFKTKLQSAKAQAASKYRTPNMPNI